MVVPGAATAELEREPTPAEAAALLPPEQAQSWKIHADGAWAGNVSATDACFLEPPIAVRVGAKWKVVLTDATCARSQRLGGFLLLSPHGGGVVVKLANAELDTLPADAVDAVLVGPGPSFTQ